MPSLADGLDRAGPVISAREEPIKAGCRRIQVSEPQLDVVHSLVIYGV